MSNINIFLKLKLKQGGEVKGDSQFNGHKDEIFLSSFSWSEVNEGGGGGAGKLSKTRIDDFQFAMRMNKASPLIMQAAATSDTVVEAVLSIRGANAADLQDYLKYTLKDGQISSYHTAASMQELIPLERFSIRFRQLAVEFRPTNSDGTLGAMIAGSFDVTKPPS